MKLITKIKQYINICLRFSRNSIFLSFFKFVKIFSITLGFYITIFTLVLNIYELRVSNINNRVNTVLSILSTPHYKKGLEIIPTIQNTRIPIEPSFGNPSSVIKSIIFRQNKYQPTLQKLYDGYHLQYNEITDFPFFPKQNNHISDLLKEIVICWKTELDSINLSDINLNNIDLIDAIFDSTLLINSDFSYSNLDGSSFLNSDFNLSNLSNTKLAYCDFRNSQIYNSNFSNCYLYDSNFTRSIIRSVIFDSARIHAIDFSNTFFWGGISNCSFNNADIRWSNFSGIDSLNIEIFENTKTLYDCKFEDEIKAQILLEYPRLFQKPLD